MSPSWTWPSASVGLQAVFVAAVLISAWDGLIPTFGTPFPPPFSAKEQHSDSRWRANNYVHEDGILPFQLCGASSAYPGAPRGTATFIHGNRRYRVVVTAASVWGESQSNGQPKRADHVEFLAFFSEELTSCLHVWGHCQSPIHLVGTILAACRMKKIIFSCVSHIP